MSKQLQNPTGAEGQMLISYMALRKAIGILGISIPIILVIGSVVAGNCDQLQGSISAFYHTNMRDIFVGALCAVGLFLFTYRGYEPIDNVAGNLACIFALGVAFFPTKLENGAYLPCNIQPIYQNELVGTIHYASAGLFFVVLAYFALFLFTKSSGDPTPNKKKRNRVYRICGAMMLICLTLLFLYVTLPKNLTSGLVYLNPTFWLETIALWAFGISWLIKGEVLLKDKEESV